MKELKLYKMYVAQSSGVGSITDSIKYGFVTDKPVSGEDLLAISQYYINNKLDASSLNKTLFTRNELENSSTLDKIVKQIIHYWSEGNYGTQTIEFEGKKFTYDIVKIVSEKELHEAITNDIYNSRPLSQEKIDGIYEIILKHNFVINYDKIKNNEFKVKVLLSGGYTYKGVPGDDILRAVIYSITGKTLLIKSKEVIRELSTSAISNELEKLIETYSTELSTVFNRHKKLFLALKNHGHSMAHTINKISKLSKKNHVPIKPALNKVFISKYSKYNHNSTSMTANMLTDLKKLNVVDKMKLISALNVIKAEPENRVFLIRNGKAFIKDEKVSYSSKYESMYNAVLLSLVGDLSFLRGKTVKYPENVDYGLPVSEKKSVGNLPFGTTITPEGSNKYLVAGMYWENRWGADDLDLSSVSISGVRTGWGQVSSYGRGVLFSGDITNAPNGAIEYIANTSDEPVVLINNIYNGNEGSKFKLVVGESDTVDKNKKYIDNPIVEVEDKFRGTCRNMTLGALYKDKFIVYSLAVGGKHVSSKKDNAILPFMLVEQLKLKELLELAGANIVTEGNEFDVDLSLENVTFDKLSNLFDESILEKQLTSV